MTVCPGRTGSSRVPSSCASAIGSDAARFAPSPPASGADPGGGTAYDDRGNAHVRLSARRFRVSDTHTPGPVLALAPGMATSTEPIWEETALPSFPRLTNDIDVDVAVIGAGVTGVTAARLLSDAGLRVALLERRTAGSGDTGHTTAHLTAVTDTDLPRLVSTLGRDHARAVWDAGLAAIDQIADFAEGMTGSCQWSWVPGFRHASIDLVGEELEHARQHLASEARLANDLGFDVTEVPRTPLVDRPGWRIEEQALLNPQQYLRGHLRALAEAGVVVTEHSEVAFTESPGVLQAGAHRVRARHVVLATHNPLAGRLSGLAANVLQTKLALYSTYVVAARLPSGSSLAPACYWDTGDPYRYVRIDRDDRGTRVIAGGEDHKTGQETDTPSRLDALERWLRVLLPDARITHRWSGQVIETPDGLPFIGEVAPGQYIATGFSGNGMTFGTLAAMIIRDAITGARANPWRDLFSPERSVIFRGPWDYLSENADYPYYLVRDRFAGARHRHLRQIARGEGALVQHDGTTVAAFRSSRGETTLLSPVCTHLGCHVAWNGADRTWDCPCHGSRFGPTGDVLAGPATEPLSPADGAKASIASPSS
jgi:glycine/D-amino acid oxidase-like deaminating enzyme